MAKQLKRGRYGDDEKAFIVKHMADKNDEWIANQLGRTPHSVQGQRRLIEATTIARPTVEGLQKEDDIVKAMLHAREDWPVIAKQYPYEELKMFEFYWARLCKQMTDMTHTEEMQVIKLIHMEMSMNRTLRAKNRILQDMERCDALIDKEYARAEDEEEPVNRDLILALQTERDNLVTAEQIRTKEFSETMERYNKLMTAMKATRDQRFQRVENSKQSFADWIRLHNEEKLRKAESHDMELMKIATMYETKRLGEWFEYEDGGVDQPLLNADTVKDEQEGTGNDGGSGSEV